MGFLPNITMKKKAIATIFFTVLLSLQVSSSMAADPTVYKVGDDSGWTAMGAVNYTEWADSKTFYVGDILRFEYSSAYHNVIQVLQPQYESCNTTMPIVKYTTGDDSITLKKESDYYFICGAPHHCEGGQKVHVRAVSRTVTQSGGAASSPTDSQSSSATSLSAMSLPAGVLMATVLAVVSMAFAYYY